MSKKKTIALFSVVVVAMLAFTPMLFACNDDATFESVAQSTARKLRPDELTYAPLSRRTAPDGGPYLHSLTRVQCADRR